MPHTLSLLVDNAPGVLDRVTGVIARRGYNVQSLGVGPAERPEVSRITLVVPGTDASAAKLHAQLLKLTNVLDAADITHIPFVERELMLVKVAAPTGSRGELMDLASVFRAKVSDISGDTLTIEVTGDLEKLAQLQELLEPYGILEARPAACAHTLRAQPRPRSLAAPMCGGPQTPSPWPSSPDSCGPGPPPSPQNAAARPSQPTRQTHDCICTTRAT